MPTITTEELLGTPKRTISTEELMGVSEPPAPTRSGIQANIAKGMVSSVAPLISGFGRFVSRHVSTPEAQKAALDEVARMEKIQKELEQGVRTETMPERISNISGQVLPDIFMATPALRMAGMLKKARFVPRLLRTGTAATAAGMGAYSGGRAAIQGEEVLPAVVSGATAGAVMHGLGKVGVTAIPKRLPFAERIGTAAGGYAAGKILSPEDDSNAAFLAGTGAMFPAKRLPTALLKEFPARTARGFERTGATIAGVEPETLSRTRELGFPNVITEENLKGKVPAIVAKTIADGFAERTEEAHTAYNKALEPVETFDISGTYNKIGKVLRDMGYVTAKGKSTGKHLNPALRDSTYTKLFNIFQASADMAGLKPLAEGQGMTGARMIREFKYGEKGKIRSLKVNKKQYIEIRDLLQSLWSGQAKDLDVKKITEQFYQDGENSGAIGLIDAKNLEAKSFEAQRELNNTLVKEGRLRNFKNLTEDQISKLKETEDYIGKPFLKDIEAYSLAQQYKTPPLSGFWPTSILRTMTRPAYRGYLRKFGTFQNPTPPAKGGSRPFKSVAGKGEEGKLSTPTEGKVEKQGFNKFKGAK